jgi:capsular polysaccharide biosynthesis protein
VELKRYLQLVLSRWKIIVIATVTATLLSAVFVWQQDSVYESSGTYVVRPRDLETDEVVRATDALNRGAEINSTYARIARSDAVNDRARSVLRSDGLSTSGLSVTATVLPGTNIIQIGASGPDPDVVAVFADAIGQETSAYLEELDEVFLLVQLDAPTTPKSAESSNGMLTMFLAMVLGAGVGATIAFAADYLDEEPPRMTMNITDGVTGAHTEDYFRFRLVQEMSRCDIPPDRRDRSKKATDAVAPRWKRDGPSKRDVAARPALVPNEKRSAPADTPITSFFSLAVMTIRLGKALANGSQAEIGPLDLRDAAQALLPQLRMEDVLAYLGDNTFAVILPDVRRKEAEKLILEWSDALPAIPRHGGDESSLFASVDTCDCDAEGLVGGTESLRIARGV